MRTSLIAGHGRSPHEHAVYGLIARTREGMLFTDNIRCPGHVSDLAAAVLQLAVNDEATGLQYVAGPDTVSRHEPGCSIPVRDGLDASRLPAGPRGGCVPEGACDICLDTHATRNRRTRAPRGAREFLRR